jgi:hypothetical protein
MKEAVNSSETPVCFSLTTRRSLLEDSHLHTPGREREISPGLTIDVCLI